MPTTLYRVEDGSTVIVHDSVDAREYIATGRYSKTALAPLEVPAAAPSVADDAQANAKTKK
jgi:hypothetical protein